MNYEPAAFDQAAFEKEKAQPDLSVHLGDLRSDDLVHRAIGLGRVTHWWLRLVKETYSSGLRMVISVPTLKFQGASLAVHMSVTIRNNRHAITMPWRVHLQGARLPTSEQILFALVKDAATTVETPFEDWAEHRNASIDSRTAFENYTQCRCNRDILEYMLGAQCFLDLAKAVKSNDLPELPRFRAS